MFGRLIVGLGTRTAAQIVPLYLSKIALKGNQRKACRNQCMHNHCGQSLVGRAVLLIKSNWKAMFDLAGVPSTIQFFGMLCMPESPRWLVKEGKSE